MPGRKREKLLQVWITEVMEAEMEAFARMHDMDKSEMTRRALRLFMDTLPAPNLLNGLLPPRLIGREAVERGWDEPYLVAKAREALINRGADAPDSIKGRDYIQQVLEAYHEAKEG
jgi:hypothetical protein